MTTLYLAPHGQTLWNTQQRIQGWQDSPLTGLGIRQAQALGRRLQQVDLAAIYASPSGRAMETARLVAGGRKLPIQADDGLREIGLGAWEGQVTADVEQAYPEAFAAFWQAPHRFRPVGGETFMQARQRVLAGLERITLAHPQGNVLVVTHTVTLKLLLAHFQKLDLEELWGPPYIHEASLSVAQMQDGAYRMLVSADTAHLSDA